MRGWRLADNKLPAAAVIVLVALTAAFIWALNPPPAEAHAILVRSDPPVNARLQDPPTVVTGYFSESLDTRLSSLQVLDGEGKRVDSGQTSFGPADTQMYANIPSQLAPGFYAVVWETLSSVDGHLLKGSFPFTVLNADGSEPSGPHPAAGGVVGYSGGGPNWDNVSTKWVGLTAAMMLVGSLAFVAWVMRPARGRQARRALEAAHGHMRRIAWSSVAVLAVTGLAELLLQARRLGGLGFVDDALSTVWGERWIQRQLVLGAIAMALFVSDRLWRSRQTRASDFGLWTALAGGLVYLLLVAMVSHGNSVPGSFWAVGADFLHLSSSAVWIGMLTQLALLFLWTRRNVDEHERAALLAAPLLRFSTLAATSVVVLLATGTVNGLSQVPTFSAMLDTAYGRALTVKLGIMAALLMVAGVNAFFLRERVIEEDEGGKLYGRLSALMRIEIGLGVAVLLVAAVLVQYPTARQEQAAAANIQATAKAVVGFEEKQTGGNVDFDLSIVPNEVGTNSYRLYVLPATGDQIGEVQRVRLRFKSPDPSVGPSEVIAEAVGPNLYKAVGPFFTRPGAWEVAVDLRRRAMDDVTVIFRPTLTGSESSGGGRFAFPLVVGSWTAVGGVGVLLAALLMTVWATQWPNLRRPVPRILRVASGFVVIIGMAIFVGSLFPAQQSASGNPVEATGQSIAIGRSMYVTNCTTCHGTDGRGDGPQASQLAIPPADFRQHIPYHTDSFFFQVISNGLGTIMPPFASQLTEEQRWDLINFLKSEYGVNAQQSGP